MRACQHAGEILASRNSETHADLAWGLLSANLHNHTNGVEHGLETLIS